MQSIKEKRKELKLRQKDVFEMTGITAERLGRFEKTGKGLWIDEFIILCNVLGLRVTISDELVTFDCKPKVK